MPPLTPVRLRSEYLENPLLIGTAVPRFSWVIPANRRQVIPTAYRILVSSEKEFAEMEAGDYWDSGKVSSDRSSQVAYDGEPLLSGKRYFWRVRCWNEADEQSPFSEIAWFETGILGEREWRAKWIGMKSPDEFRSRRSHMLGSEAGETTQALAVYLRKEFKLRGPVRRARAYASGLGFYEFRLNGRKIGDQILNPALTDYRKIAFYSAFDITDALEEKNAVGVILGNGFHFRDFGYGPPRLILQIHLEYEDEDFVKIASDETWKTGHGPLRENGIYYGERYDARLEMDDWDRPGFDDSSWGNAVILSGPPLAPQTVQSIRVTETLKPQKFWSAGAGIHVFDFGQNFSGWARIRVEGPRGTEIRLRYAELINGDGTINTLPNQNAENTDAYVLKGRGSESWEPRFTYHGFRYLEISGWPGEPSLDQVDGRFVHTDAPRTGEFACSDDLLNRIHDIVVRSQRSNLMSIPTDCPQRDERLGWLGDAHLSAEEAILNFDLSAFYSNFMESIRLAQKSDGSLPDIVPPYLESLYPADPAWAAAYFELARLMYWYYGDVRILERHFSSIKKYLDFLAAQADGLIVRKLGKYGDWCQPGSTVPQKTPLELSSTWYFQRGLSLLAEFACVIGRMDEFKIHEARAKEAASAFNAAFFSDGLYGAPRKNGEDQSPDQTSQILPLAAGLVPEERKESVLRGLLHSIAAEHNDHLNTGILGTRYLLDVLSENDNEEIAFRIARQKSYPGWGYMIEQGATTLWERWEKLTGAGMNSQNHVMFGSVGAWLYKWIAGVSPLEPGWMRIRFRPPILDGLFSASARLDTIRGHVSISWKIAEDAFEIETQVPAGSKGEVFIPLLGDSAQIKENGDVVGGMDGPKQITPAIAFLRKDGRYAVFEIESGGYAFSCIRNPV